VGANRDVEIPQRYEAAGKQTGSEGGRRKTVRNGLGEQSEAPMPQDGRGN
jgi:hypothetical protein